jgi:hypothetical protein
MNKYDINYLLFTKNNVCTQLKIFQKEIKLTLNQELMHIHIRRKRLISKSDYNFKSGCT